MKVTEIRRYGVIVRRIGGWVSKMSETVSLVGNSRGRGRRKTTRFVDSTASAERYMEKIVDSISSV